MGSDRLRSLRSARLSGGGAVLSPGASSARRKDGERTGVSRLRTEVFHHLFAAIAEEMGASLLRSSFSPNIKERRDFSCALFDGRGRMIGQAAHLPVHLGSTPLSVAACLEAIDLEPGDAAVLNDPYRGGTHLPDVTLVSPVFLPGSRRPDYFCANRAHHADVGGAYPGSMAPTVDVHGEGIRIPPVRLVRRGEIVAEIMDLLLANMRVPRERRGDLLAQWAANRVGAQRLEELAAEHGADEVRSRARELMSWSEDLSRALVERLPSGSYRFEDELEVTVRARRTTRNARIRLELRKEEGELVFDFTRTDDEVDAPLNTVRAVAVSAVLYVLRLFLPSYTPTNDGILRPVRILTRPGSLIDARYPRGVAAGNVETSQRIVDVLLGALARALPGAVPAASAGTMSNLTFGGTRPDSDEGFAYYETIAGGAGAAAEGPGAHATHTHMTNTRNTPIETLETQYPVRVLAYTVRRGSGGSGRAAGGDGIRKRVRFLVPVRASWMAERGASGPWGLAGGGPGRAGSARVRLPGSTRERRLGARESVDLPAGSELEVRTPGGGGFGRIARSGRRT